MSTREPILQPVAIKDLHPTQITVGMREVAEKRKQWRAHVDEGVKDILVNVIGDLRDIHKHSFWIFLDHHGWCHPYDDKGTRRNFGSIPSSIEKLRDDPFRSLAGEARRSGGFAKESTPFVEFLWADYFRRRVSRKEVDSDFAATLVWAVKLARSKDADYMPGWCGPHQPGGDA